MKKTALYCLIILGAGLFGGCGEDFLDKEPPLYFNEGEVFADAEKTEGNLLSLYAAIKDNNIFGGRIILVSDNIGDDVINVSGNGVELYNTYETKVGLNTQENNNFWGAAYLAINKCNTFLKLIDENRELAGDKYDLYVAEARFVRAITYYYLHQLYTKPYVLDSNAPSVPLRLTAESDILNNDLARASSQQVIDQILSDLSVTTALPAGNGTEATVTRATPSAVEALKMRIYMITGDWQKAIEAGQKVTGYSLAPDVTTIFLPPFITPENIFSIPFSSTNRGASQSAVAYYYLNEKSLAIDTLGGITGITGYDNPNDQRISKLTNIGEGKRTLTKFTDATYVEWVPVFRYAEILLNLAECYANIGRETEAIAALKQVRSRSLKPEDDTLVLDALTGDALKTAIRNERRLEFLGEGLRGFDLMRRAETIVKQPASQAPITVSPADGINGYIWPVPGNERSQNKLITD
ncbi:MAG: RagB/SusD family nutrient uptake outer membrane protein [Tannerella sp.]|jgi:tetratricopeptide (TPR) repeat protein|nr:RagB/SusD family nutrient uptake outer membrane protein [Tannerella sp.]